MDLNSWVFLMAFAKSFAHDSTLIFLDFCFNGIVSVTISSVNTDFSMFS